MTAHSASPPVAKAVPHTLRAHDDERIDDYYWLRDRDDADTIAYLEAENAYTKAEMASTEALQERLFEEIKSRIQETDLSVPVRRGAWWYYSRTEEGKQYAISCRRPATEDRSYDAAAAEVVLFDQNVEAEGHEFYEVGVFDLSPNQQLLAYAADTNGSETYDLRFRDLTTGDRSEERRVGKECA